MIASKNFFSAYYYYFYFSKLSEAGRRAIWTEDKEINLRIKKYKIPLPDKEERDFHYGRE